MMRARMAVTATIFGVAALTVGACGGDDGGSGSGGGGGGGGKKEVVYVPGLTGNPFYTTVSCGATSAAKELGNVKFSTQGSPEFDVAKQTSIVNSLTASKPDAIMISITDPKAMIAPLTQAKAAGIKIVTVDGDLSDDSVGESNIQSNNEEGGKLAADRLGEVAGGKGSVVIVDNSPGSLISGARVKGFNDELKAKYPQMRSLGVKYSDNDVTKAASTVTAAATGNKDLSGVYTVETNNTEGALTGVREAKLEGKVHIVGYDTSDPIVKALQDGKLDGAIVQFPFGEGQEGLKTAVKAIDGESVPRQQSAPFVVATPKNVDTPKVKKYIYSTTCSQ